MYVIFVISSPRVSTSLVYKLWIGCVKCCCCCFPYAAHIRMRFSCKQDKCTGHCRVLCWCNIPRIYNIVIYMIYHKYGGIGGYANSSAYLWFFLLLFAYSLFRWINILKSLEDTGKIFAKTSFFSFCCYCYSLIKDLNFILLYTEDGSKVRWRRRVHLIHAISFIFSVTNIFI